MRGRLPGMSAIRVSLVVGLVLVPGLAWAGNGTHPRTPVLWEPEPACMTIVDRSVDPVLEFSYTILYEDVVPPEAMDEVEDSRRHQFLAFCRQHSVQVPLPIWLSQADVDKADEKNLVDPLGLTPADIIDTSPEWMDCMVRITADDQRRPITFAEAMKPVVWDTTGLPVGPYVIDGYTWEPAFNIYSLRNGVVKVIDDPDPAMSPPALAIRNHLDDDVIVYKDQDLRVFGCFDAMDGSTITGYWAQTDNEGGDLTWNAFGADTPVEGGEFELAFTPPEETLGKLVAMRVDITDPQDRTYTAHMDVLVSVLSLPAPTDTSGGECEGSGIFFDPDCGSGGGTDDTAGDTSGAAGTGTGASGIGPTEGGEGSTSGSTGLEETPTPKESCAGCAVGGPGGSLVWLVGVACLRRRRR